MDKDGPGKAGAAGTLVTVKKTTPNLRSDKDYVHARKEGTGGTEKAAVIPMSQFDSIVEEGPEEANTGVAGSTAGGTEPRLPSAAPPDTVGGGRLQPRPIRMFSKERGEKAKGKGGTDKPKEPEK